MRATIRKRYILIVLSVFVLAFSAWLVLFFQRKQDLIGGGIDRTFLFLLINVHLVVSIILLYLIIRQSVKLFIERRHKVPGSVFKRNLFFSFIIISVIPVTFVFFIAGKLITTSIDNWFQVRLGTGLNNGLYLHEQQTKQERKGVDRAGNLVAGKFQEIGVPGDGESIESFVKNYLEQLQKKHTVLSNYKIYVWEEAGNSFVGSISDEVHVWRTFRKHNDRSTKSLRRYFLKELSSEKMFDFYGSLYWVQKVTLPFFTENLFLVLVHRYQPHIRYPLIEVQNAIIDYSQLKSIKNPIYWSYLLNFLFITLLILFLSIWCAFFLARGISMPIQQLLLAIKKIRAGDLSVRVTVRPPDDLRPLVTGFNNMTDSLQRAYKKLEFHNKEMLLMLEHIKESVFFIDNHGRILAFNKASKKLVEKYLGVSRFKNKKINVFGEYVKKVFFSLVRKLKKSDKVYFSQEVSFSHDDERKTFMIYLSIVQFESSSLVVVIEDLSGVYKMNKIKTWQEAATQIAHEIKNPLTPIQLATQRLQRKLRKKGHDEPILMECADTILQQVKIIKDLVAHFSEFAKMPDSQIEALDINKIIREIGSLYEMSYPEIIFKYNLQKFLPAFKADRKKMKRVVVNLLDNSVRALQAHEAQEKEILLKTSFKSGRNQIELLIADNGPGIPKDVRERLFLPYVSSGSKNMGLGLAIVHDIVSQTGGSIKLLPSSKGAIFQILLPV